MSQPILIGDISITDNINFIREIIFGGIPNTKIINLDESGSLPSDHKDVIGGTCLLPPVDAMIAEADGDEPVFDAIYADYFKEGFISQFIGALMIYLSGGGNLVLYFPDLRLNIVSKLRQHIDMAFGIRIGVIGVEPCVYNISYASEWLNRVYMQCGIHALVYLAKYSTVIPDQVMDRLIMDLMPMGETYQDKVNYIIQLQFKLQTKPNVKPALISLK